MCFAFKGIYIDPWRIYTAPILGWRVITSADAKHRSSFFELRYGLGNSLIFRGADHRERPAAQTRRSARHTLLRLIPRSSHMGTWI